MAKHTRKHFLQTLTSAAVAAGGMSLLATTGCSPKGGRQPNVVLIMTDDQGYGDLGIHGNDKIKTPNLDRLAGEGVELTRFYVSPMCAPTRASLMTGRYNYRTGVVDTSRSRAMMHPDEVTIAEIFSSAGYRTGIFGKWHLGDNYPLRAIDQGFQEAVVHNSGGIGQPGDPPGNSYFDPVFQHNGQPQQYQGYCTDIFFTAALEFITRHKDDSFFVYLPTNAPHTPLEITDEYADPYRAMGLQDNDARLYGMVTNIDDNLYRLLNRMKQLDLESDTIVVFLSDNGPQWQRYNAGLRGRKTSVYDGGIRVPCIVRWPGKLKEGLKIDRIAAHIDILPTLLEACGIPRPGKLSIDGVSLIPLLGREQVKWADRNLYFQMDRRQDVPRLYSNCAVRSQRYKLVNGVELYDMELDPGEANNITAGHPDIVSRMRHDYEAWFRDVAGTRSFAIPRIRVGTPHENPVHLSLQDRRWPDHFYRHGHWKIDVRRAGAYEITLAFDHGEPPGGAAEAHLRLGSTYLKQTMARGIANCTYRAVSLAPGWADLEAWLQAGGEEVLVSDVYLRCLNL